NSGATLVVGSPTAAGSLPTTTRLISNGTTNFAANPAGGILARTLAGITLSSTGRVVVANSSSGKTVLDTADLIFGGGTGAWQGVLDLSNNNTIVRTGSPTVIADQIKSGYAGGSWNGNGITSSAAFAAASSAHKTALGYAQ